MSRLYSHPREYRKIFLGNYLCIGFVPGGNLRHFALLKRGCANSVLGLELTDNVLQNVSVLAELDVCLLARDLMMPPGHAERSIWGAKGALDINSKRTSVIEPRDDQANKPDIPYPCYQGVELLVAFHPRPQIASDLGRNVSRSSNPH